MAVYNFDKLNYNDDLYYSRDTKNLLVKGTQNSSTNSWTGSLPAGIVEYEDGLVIDYYLPYSGTSAEATLNLSGVGAKPVYLGDSSTPVTNQFSQHSVIRLTYIVSPSLNSGNGCWKAGAYVNTTNPGTITGITTTSPLSGSGTSGSVSLSHANSGVTAASKGDTTNQTPTWGGTFKALSGTVNATGHLTVFGEHTVKIPNSTATTSAVGLMSVADKTKLNSIVLDSDGKLSTDIIPSIVIAYPKSGATELSSTWLSTSSISGSALTPQEKVIYILAVASTNYCANSQFRWNGTSYVQLIDKIDETFTAITNSEIDTIMA